MKKIEAKTKNQQIYIDSINKNKITFCDGVAGTGKASPLDSIVYTVNGPKLMGDITVSDRVLTPTGTANVIAIYPQGIKDIYKISFKDGSYVEACLEHLWKVYDSVLNKHIITNTENILNKYKTKNGRCRYHIELPNPVKFSKKDVGIDPYLLGLILGDGGITTNISFSTSDKEIITSISQLLPEGHIISKKKRGKYDYSVTSPRGKRNIILEHLQAYGLKGCKSHKKFIPDIYKYNDIHTRLSVLQGLLDTDGSISLSGSTSNVEYTTTSSQLALDVKVLVESLGGICRIVERYTFYTYKSIKKQGRKSYRCHIKLEGLPLFKLPRKAVLIRKKLKYFPKRIINKVEFSRKAEAQCIKIDSEDSLYLMDNFVITHNTFIATLSACYLLLEKKIERIVISRPLVQADVPIGHLPGTLEEKLAPYVRPVMDVLEETVNRAALDKYIASGKIEVLPFTTMQGRTLSNTFTIIEESQNCTFEQLVLALTRFGKNSRMVLSGDSRQSYLPVSKQGGLTRFMDRLSGLNNVGLVRLGNEDIVREPIVKAILERLDEDQRPQTSTGA